MMLFILGIHEKTILKKRKVTHILAIHDKAEAKWPDVSCLAKRQGINLALVN